MHALQVYNTRTISTKQPNNPLEFTSQAFQIAGIPNPRIARPSTILNAETSTLARNARVQSSRNVGNIDPPKRSLVRSSPSNSTPTPNSITLVVPKHTAVAFRGWGKCMISPSGCHVVFNRVADRRSDVTRGMQATFPDPALRARLVNEGQRRRAGVSIRTGVPSDPSRFPNLSLILHTRLL